MKTRQAKFNPRHSVFYARCPYCGALVVFWSASAVAGACRHFQGIDGLSVYFDDSKAVRPELGNRQAGRREKRQC